VVTIRDIAKAAGVSPMTVSNVINDHPHVKDSTRERVLETMKALDYRVNIAARNLRRGRTHTIGLAVPEVDRPYFGQLGAAVIADAERYGFQVVIEQTNRSRENELSAISQSRVRMYDGLILSTVGLGEADLELLRVDFPVVLLGERIFTGTVDHVGMANVQGAEAAVHHLLDRGSRLVLVMHGGISDDVDVSSLRHEGYMRALESRGLPVDPALTLTISEFTPGAAARGIAGALRSGLDFDAVFCVTDYVAIGALRALADAGVRVPQDVRVIGFDDVELSRFVVPSLSTVDPDHGVMARTAVELLVSRINGSRRPPVEFVGPYRVVEREPTAA